MKTKLLVFKIRAETPEMFEARVTKVVATLGKIIGVKAHEADGSVYIQLDYTDKEANQECCVLAWLDVRNAEETINNTLSHVELSGKRVCHINLAIQSQTGRILAAIIVESDLHDNGITNETETLSSKEDRNSEAEGQADQQDEDTDAEPIAAAKPSVKPKNSGAAKRGSKGNR